jgi:hypothetical protein
VTLLFSDKKSEEEKGAFFFWMDFAMHGANKKFTKAFHLKRSQSHPKGDGDFSATSFSAPDPQADRRDRLLCVRILIHISRRGGR